MEYRGLRIASDILFKIFLIGYVILIISWFAYVLFRGHWETLFVTQWHFANFEFVELLTLIFFTIAKFVLIFYALVPAIAIRWTLSKMAKKSV